eukprot:5835362-Pyramimonas_sp.AAC.1
MKIAAMETVGAADAMGSWEVRFAAAAGALPDGVPGAVARWNVACKCEKVSIGPISDAAGDGTWSRGV